MPGCQVIKPNDKYCRNFSMTGKTCCYQHRHLEEVSESDSEYQESEQQISEEISVITSEEELSEIENYDSDGSEDPLWGPEEVDEDGCVFQTMNSVFPWKK
jgi:hypothetical protein